MVLPEPGRPMREIISNRSYRCIGGRPHGWAKVLKTSSYQSTLLCYGTVTAIVTLAPRLSVINIFALPVVIPVTLKLLPESDTIATLVVLLTTLYEAVPPPIEYVTVEPTAKVTLDGTVV